MFNASLEWRCACLLSHLKRDASMFAPQLAASLAVSAPAVGRYVDLLVDLLLIRRLPAWSS